MIAADRDARHAGVVATTLYAAFAALLFLEQPGKSTNDTRVELTEDPTGFLARTLTLWNPDASLGELQNQAYGYLFPQGTWFVVWDQIGVPAWLAQRGWSVLLLVVACEGMRRLARAMALAPWPALAAGLAYGLAPRHVTELSVRSAEILPAMVLPWVLLPIVQALDGRRRPWHAAVLSAAAYGCSGGVNGTATAAPLALVFVVVGWAVATGRLPWRFAALWGALVVTVSAWWAVALVRLGAYSPPFFDFVEDADVTTSTSGFSAALRGATNWVGYLVEGGQPWWPAGYTLSYEAWPVLGSGLVAVLGLVGLLRYDGRFRAPLLWAVVLGVTCQVAAHTGPLAGPFASPLQELLDGALAPLRNIAKADPILRLPLSLGVGLFLAEALRVLERPRGVVAWRRVAAAGTGVAMVFGLTAMATPIVQAQTRTPGWDELPDHWHRAADFLADRAGQGEGGVTWVAPGSGFGIQDWGWTMEEAMYAVAESRWVTRSQVPLAPPATIRMLTRLEERVTRGSRVPGLAAVLGRIGIDSVLVRHDLDRSVTDTPPADVVSAALSQSPGVRRIATFGGDEFPVLELFEVPGGGAEGYRIGDVADTPTVAFASDDVLAAAAAGRLPGVAPTVVEGTPGWDAVADVVSDARRLRDRAFGRVHDAEGVVMPQGEPSRTGRDPRDYPASPEGPHVVARYVGIDGVTASSSVGWADTLGAVRPESAPWAALDGDPTTYWQPARLTDADAQWWQVDLGSEQPLGRVEIRQPAARTDLARVLAWRVVADGTGTVARVNPFTAVAAVDLGGVRADSLRLEVAEVDDPRAPVGLGEVNIDGVDAARTLVVPRTPHRAEADFLLTSGAGARACVETIGGVRCDPDRQRASPEAAGIDRTVEIRTPGRWRVSGGAVARSTRASAALLQPLGLSVSGSSWLAEDPLVSPRMAHDGDPTSSWLADHRDARPRLRIDLGEVQNLTEIDVQPPTGQGVLPTRLVLRAGGEVRRVSGRGGEFAPLAARRLTIVLRGDVPPGRTLGVGEVRLPGSALTRPMDRSDPTGSACGYGPMLEVDGTRVRTQVQGTVGQVLAGGALRVQPCGTDRDRRLEWGTGAHRVRLLSTAQFQPVRLLLAGGRDAREAPSSRTLQVTSSTDTRARVEVSSGEDAVLAAPYNRNEGWQAHVDGVRLEPITIDGWAQGWLIPDDVRGEVVIDFAPERGYRVGLVAGLVLLGAVLLVALVLLAVTRLSAAAPTRSPGRREHRRPTSPVLRGAAAGVLAGLVAGPVVALAAVAGATLRTRPRLAVAVAAVLTAGALLVHTVVLVDGAGRPGTVVDLLTGSGLALGLAAALTAGRRDNG